MTYRMHIYDMFDEMPVMASRGPIKSLFKNLHWHHCLYVFFCSVNSMKFWAVIQS